MRRTLPALALVLLALASTAACGGSDAESKPAKTVTVTEAAKPTPTPTSENTGFSAQDARATAIYTLQTETTAFKNFSEDSIVQAMELICGQLLLADGKNVSPEDMKSAGLLVTDGLRGTAKDVPIVLRTTIVFCPEAADEVIAKYATQP